jgi:(p)ppGpp synthase/HD superfamily hydrolase
MIKYTERLDLALRKSSRAFEQAGRYRKGTDIPYIMHPVAVMLLASNVTDDEDILIACLMHDILEDVDDEIYSEAEMLRDFGDRVVEIVKDVTKDESIKEWHKRSQAYLNHLRYEASEEAVIVAICDKIHNLLSTVMDYDSVGDEVWLRFRTKNAEDQKWWYRSVLEVAKERKIPTVLVTQLNNLINSLFEKNNF